LEENIPFVMALGPSHAWWAPQDQVGNVWEAALFSTVSSWDGPEDPGEWVRLERSFRDGRVERWWALEAQGGPYSPQKSERLVVVTIDPATLPDRSTSYLVTNLPAPGSERAQRSPHSVAELAEVARLYTLRGWIEQSYKQVKNALGWAHYQGSQGHLHPPYPSTAPPIARPPTRSQDAGTPPGWGRSLLPYCASLAPG
jgi:hypothetical protein